MQLLNFTFYIPNGYVIRQLETNWSTENKISLRTKRSFDYIYLKNIMITAHVTLLHNVTAIPSTSQLRFFALRSHVEVQDDQSQTGVCCLRHLENKSDTRKSIHR